MSFVITFSPAGVTTAKYETVIEKLIATGAGAPKGRNYHVCYGDQDSVQITEVWQSMEDFQAFGETLMPILQSFGIDPGQPTPQEVHNVIVG